VAPMRSAGTAEAPSFVFDSVDNTGQYVVPRYGVEINAAHWPASRSLAPAGQLIGDGPGCVLTGNARTQRLPEACRAIVVTEDFDQTTAMFGSGEHGQRYKPAVLRPVFRDFTLCGHDDTGVPVWTDHGKVGDEPGTQNADWPDLYGGLWCKATGPIVDGVNFFYIPGTALWVGRTGAARAGRLAPFDTEKGRFHNLYFCRCYRGFDLNVIDAYCGGIQGVGLRDFGVKFSGGATQIDGAIHFWGVSPGPAVWFPTTAGPCEGGPFYLDNSRTGMLVESARNTLGPVKGVGCPFVTVDIANERNKIQLAEIILEHPDAIGVRVNSQHNTVRGGTIDLRHTSAVGVLLLQGGNGASGKRFTLSTDFIGNGKNTAVIAREPLNGCDIQANFHSVATGLALRGGIGKGNRIWITTEAVNTPIWTTGDWDAESNDIRINGVPYV
jgi:hypothetical protein